MSAALGLTSSPRTSESRFNALSAAHRNGQPIGWNQGTYYHVMGSPTPGTDLSYEIRWDASAQCWVVVFDLSEQGRVCQTDPGGGLPGPGQAEMQNVVARTGGEITYESTPWNPMGDVTTKDLQVRLVGSLTWQSWIVDNASNRESPIEGGICPSGGTTYHNDSLSPSARRVWGCQP